MESGYAQPWFYGMSHAFSISRNHPYTTQLREDLTMKRFRVCLMGLVVVLSLWTAPAGAQDKFTMGYGSGT